MIQYVSLEVVNVIQEESFGGFTSALVKRIRQLLESTRVWRIQYISCDENNIVDGLVWMVRDKRSGLRLFKDPL
ncbi:hypothetical protein Goshw_008539 [Gossypium schwendimanii]|uniref:RNase H type-1 domain-containing protein n=1 Tax=Gossypium schwendimanii TaxID=34291 RepID=A0A7J9MW99_GOSSC|nr:hypothetical protein [Gossypium schwendimanii]